MAPAGKPGVGKGEGKIIKILISCFLFRSPGSLDQDFHQLVSRGWARVKVRYLRYLFLVFFSAGHVEPGVGQGKGKILISCFLFSSPGSPDQEYHRLASRGFAREKVRYLR